MDTLTITKTNTGRNARIFIPSSKSYIHRYLISALMADGESVIENVSFSKDIEATLSCIEELGARTEISGKTIRVWGCKDKKEFASLFCGESASTLRFMIPVAKNFARKVEYRGANSLFMRPLDPYFDIFSENSMPYQFKKGEYLTLEGDFKEKKYIIDGGVSSQFVTGLLYALPQKPFDSVIEIKGELMSKPYVDITLEVLGNSGIKVHNNDYKSFSVIGNQRFVSGNYFAQGDYSQVAFFLVAGCFLGNIECVNMEPCSLQGDKAIVDILRSMGADIRPIEKGFAVGKSKLKSIGTIDASHIPDIVPILSLACALSEGTTVIKGIERLKIKECDRAFATVDVLTKLGANICEREGSLVIEGKVQLDGGRVSSFGDHRMAMTAAIASLVCKEDVTIENPMSITKSYPSFYDDLLSTGAVKYQKRDD